ncbi:MAG: hypothetical protein M3Z10_13515 [Gemmatimonadota bacterium]|nr:hypothetical protein [Gemmatimonadota bacterium]
MPATPCTYLPADHRGQRQEYLPGLIDHAVERSAVSHGMRFRFVATAERLRQIATVAEHERAYCEALEFRVGLGLGRASLTLDVTGPAGTERFLAQLLDAPIAA